MLDCFQVVIDPQNHLLFYINCKQLSNFVSLLNLIHFIYAYFQLKFFSFGLFCWFYLIILLFSLLTIDLNVFSGQWVYIYIYNSIGREQFIANNCEMLKSLILIHIFSFVHSFIHPPSTHFGVKFSFPW